MVYINHEYKIIVIENPKSGSTTLVRSLEQALDIKISRKTRHATIHMTSNEARNKYTEYWNNYLKITTYRDPFDRFISSISMRFHIAIYDINQYEHGGDLNLDKLETYFKNNKNTYCFCRPQEHYTTGMDVLICIENFQKDFDILCDRLKVGRVVVPHLNQNTIPRVSDPSLRALFDRLNV